MWFSNIKLETGVIKGICDKHAIKMLKDEWWEYTRMPEKQFIYKITVDAIKMKIMEKMYWIQK